MIIFELQDVDALLLQQIESAAQNQWIMPLRVAFDE